MFAVAVYGEVLTWVMLNWFACFGVEVGEEVSFYGVVFHFLDSRFWLCAAYRHANL